MFDDTFNVTREQLRATPFAQIDHVEQTRSTNEDIAAILGMPGSAGRTIVTDLQSHGTGRRGRIWVAHPGASLLFTTALPAPVPVAYLWSVTLWTGLVVARALHSHGIPVELRWPNDLLLRESKLAGILCLSRVIGAQAWVGCGVGINLVRNAAMASMISPEPAFCDDIAHVERAVLLASILRVMNEHLELLAQPLQIRSQWEEAANLIGSTYRILRDGEDHPFDAEVLGMTEDGSLRVHRNNGANEIVTLGDCRILR